MTEECEKRALTDRLSTLRTLERRTLISRKNRLYEICLHKLTHFQTCGQGHHIGWRIRRKAGLSQTVSTTAPAASRNPSLLLEGLREKAPHPNHFWKFVTRSKICNHTATLGLGCELPRKRHPAAVFKWGLYIHIYTENPSWNSPTCFISSPHSEIFYFCSPTVLWAHGSAYYFWLILLLKKRKLM